MQIYREIVLVILNQTEVVSCHLEVPNLFYNLNSTELNHTLHAYHLKSTGLINLAI